MEAELITYCTDKNRFESVYERNQFYRGLFGYTQTVKKNGKEYKYEKEGIADEEGITKIDDSVFVAKKDKAEEIKQYFDEWKNKVSHHVFKVQINDKEVEERLK